MVTEGKSQLCTLTIFQEGFAPLSPSTWKALLQVDLATLTTPLTLPPLSFLSPAPIMCTYSVLYLLCQIVLVCLSATLEAPAAQESWSS
jgi:hypothetical protein